MKYYFFFSINVIPIALLQHKVGNDDFNTEMSC